MQWWCNQLRNAYNGGWVLDWNNEDKVKYCIYLYDGEITAGEYWSTTEILHFKTRGLRDEFLRNFRPLIEKLKPLYGIKEGGKQ